MLRVVWYNQDVPAKYEKLSVQIGVKISESMNAEIERIAGKEMRKVGEVVRMLMLRGLSLYHQDGNLLGEPAHKAKVVATISPGLTKPEVQRNFEREILVPVHDEGTIGKRASKRKAK